MKTLKERTVVVKSELGELAERVVDQSQERGRDSAMTNPSEERPVGPLNSQNTWDKGWNKYGKT